MKIQGTSQLLLFVLSGLRIQAELFQACTFLVDAVESDIQGVSFADIQPRVPNNRAWKSLCLLEVQDRRLWGFRRVFWGFIVWDLLFGVASFHLEEPYETQKRSLCPICSPSPCNLHVRSSESSKSSQPSCPQPTTARKPHILKPTTSQS